MRIWTTCCALTIVLSSLAGWSGVGMAATPQVTGHRGFTLALSANGELRSWGSNHFGDLGDGSTQQREQPLVIGTGYRQVRASGSGIFGLKDDGSLWAWGDGQLGLGSSSSAQVPTLVGTAFKDVVPGFGCHYGIKTDNTLWGWGTNANGEYVRLADGTQICTRTNLSAATNSLLAITNVTVAHAGGYVAWVTNAINNSEFININ